jgi:hypothetical protein
MSADASADIQAIQQETVTITGVHYSYTATQLTPTQSFRLLNSFTVSGRGPSDPSGAFHVTVSDPSGFRSVLYDALLDRRSEINTNMETNIEAQIRSWIQDDDLINSVENSVADAHCMIDISGGASAMRDLFDTNALDGDNYAKVLYTQISKENLNLYVDGSEEPITNALPLKQGDALVFAWNITPTVGSFHYFQTDMTGGSIGSAVSGEYSSSKNITGADTRHAVVIQLAVPTAAGARFAVNGDSGSTAGARLKGPSGTA